MVSVVVLTTTLLSEESISNFLTENGSGWQRSSSSSAYELLCEFAGRICYMSFGEKQHRKTNRDYLSNILAQGHESVLEHANWTVLISHISRACSHQIVRHRVGWAFSQLSQQYHEETKPQFLIPSEISNNPILSTIWKNALDSAFLAYKKTLDSLKDDTITDSYSDREKKRLIRTAARGALPNATETKIVATVNARALRHFFEIRGSTPGDLEMRELSCKLYDSIQPTAPNLFMDFEKRTLVDGIDAIMKLSS